MSWSHKARASFQAQKISTPSSPVYPVRATVARTLPMMASRKWKDLRSTRLAASRPICARTAKAFGPCRAMSAVSSLLSAKSQWSLAARAKTATIFSRLPALQTTSQRSSAAR